MRLWIAVLMFLVSGLPGVAARRAEPSPLPDSAYVNGFVGHAQSYHLSCESRSAVDWAAFFGVTLNESTFLFDLPRSDNPDVGFVGFFNDPWGYTPPSSYGVHAAPVAELLRANGVQAVARRGLQWDDLRAEIGNGRPVIVWVVGNVWQGTPLSYTAADGHTTTVAAYEHTMVLIGYDPTSVYLVNAASGQVEGHALTSFLSSWAVLGNMAVMAADPLSAAADGKAYVVEAGDSLLSIAARYNLSWRELAVYNDLETPDVIFVGQVLQIPEVQADADETVDTLETAAAAAETAVSIPSPSTATYTVRRGDHLMQIARTLGVDWQTIAELNDLSPPQYVVYPGQVLQLAETPAPSSSPAAATYTVRAGDNLHKIARRFGLDWPALAEANALSSPDQIYVGQVLQIPTAANE